MPALSVSDIANRRYYLAGHQAAAAGLVSRYASAGSRQEGPVQHRTGSPARDLDQRRLADPAQADAGDDRTGPPLHAWRRRATDRDLSAVSAPAKAPGAVGAAIRPLSLPWRPPQMAVRCIPAFRSCAASKLAKPNGYAPASWPERLSSATAANGFAALPSSRVSSMNAMSPAPIAEPHATLPSA